VLDCFNYLCNTREPTAFSLTVGYVLDTNEALYPPATATIAFLCHIYL